MVHFKWKTEKCIWNIVVDAWGLGKLWRVGGKR